ncbi:MAG: phosphate starvation-inducible protein PhoH [Rhodospirillaceae bacterium]|nr:phosphate starvation-inducible protein PhoH [Alphaproteobacteria bacterium]MBR72874.1 phosphate starvation-inducible protein PhoH [Rhodospirillaceae bacterium]|tara:strand:- start:2307 stop:3308 length:1002 start_codon:yes stop_codon:yes gene_type:complete
MTVNDFSLPKTTSEQIQMKFEKNSLLLLLFGNHDSHLTKIEQSLDVIISSRGNEVSISGSSNAIFHARNVLEDLYEQLEKGRTIDLADVDASIKMHGQKISLVNKISDKENIRAHKRTIRPRSPNQINYMHALRQTDLTFALGPAGTGKTYLAVAVAVSLFVGGEVDRIILSRPAVEAGERLGFLPGDIKDKVDPYFRPLYDALYDMLPPEQVSRRIETGEIEIAPLAFMRGRTLSNAFVILDEAQNTTPMQMKMFVTRLGEYSRMAITGDLSQVDLPNGINSGLTEAVKVLDGVDHTKIIRFKDSDVVRNPLVTRIVRAYEAYEAKGNNEKK